MVWVRAICIDIVLTAAVTVVLLTQLIVGVIFGDAAETSIAILRWR